MTRRELTELLEEAFVEWATEQRDARGDIFATAQDLENIKSDPLAFDRMLQGEDAYEFLRRVLAAQSRREEAAEMAELAAWRRAQTFVTSGGFRLRYTDGEWTDGDLAFHADASGWPVDDEGEQLEGRFTKGDR
jgi:hypothetical protein